MRVVATVCYQQLEGGFWGLVGDDGRKYRPLEGLPEAHRVSGAKVRVELERARAVGVCMWGRAVRVESIEAVAD